MGCAAGKIALTRSEQSKRARVNAPVEDHVDSLDSNRRVKNNALASLLVRNNGHLTTLVLIGDERGHVGFDTTSANANDEERGDETTHTGAVCEGAWDGGRSQDDQSDDVDEAEDEDCVVLSEILKESVSQLQGDLAGTGLEVIFGRQNEDKKGQTYLIGDDGTKDWRDIAPELEESGQSGSTLVSHTKGSATFAPIKGSTDVVLENTRGTVVSESCKREL